jgi:hypothetical protein
MFQNHSLDPEEFGIVPVVVFFSVATLTMLPGSNPLEHAESLGGASVLRERHGFVEQRFPTRIARVPRISHVRAASSRDRSGVH